MLIQVISVEMLYGNFLKLLRKRNIKSFEKFTFCTLISDSFKAIIQYLEKMALVDDHDASRSTGRISMLAFIDKYEGSASFLKKIITKSKHVRIGIADVCMANIVMDLKELAGYP